MTYKIARSRAGAGFELAVAHHAEHMRDWRKQESLVARDIANKVSIEDAHAPFPRPRSREEIEAAVNENDEPDFEIVEDGPTPDQILQAKKYELLQKIAVAEQDAIAAASLPLGKRRAANLLESDILAADASRTAEIKPPGLTKKVLAAVGLVDMPAPEDVAAAVRTARPDEHNDHIDAQEDRRRRVDGIIRQASAMMSDVEDLTLDTIEKWQMPTFEDSK